MNITKNITRPLWDDRFTLSKNWKLSIAWSGRIILAFTLAYILTYQLGKPSIEYKQPLVKAYTHKEIEAEKLQEQVNELRDKYETTSWTSPYDELFQKHAGKNWKLLRAICRSESGLRPDVIGPTNDYGLCQIVPKWHADKFNDFYSEWMIPEKNIQVASVIMGKNLEGVNLWTNYRNGAYKVFYN